MELVLCLACQYVQVKEKCLCVAGLQVNESFLRLTEVMKRSEQPVLLKSYGAGCFLL